MLQFAVIAETATTVDVGGEHDGVGIGIVKEVHRVAIPFGRDEAIVGVARLRRRNAIGVERRGYEDATAT